MEGSWEVMEGSGEVMGMGGERMLEMVDMVVREWVWEKRMKRKREKDEDNVVRSRKGVR